MPSKLLAFTDPENHFFGATDGFVQVSRMHIEQGPCLVQATGTLSGPGALASLKLEVTGFFGEHIAAQESLYVASSSQTFILTVAAKVPFEGGGGSEGTPIPPGAAATLSAHPTGPALATPGHLVGISDIMITALTVDEVVLV